MKHILLLTILSALPFSALVISAAPPKKEAEPIPEKKIGPKEKLNFIGKLLEKEKIEPEKKEGDKKKAEDKKGKKGKKGGRSHLLKFQVIIFSNFIEAKVFWLISIFNKFKIYILLIE